MQEQVSSPRAAVQTTAPKAHEGETETREAVSARGHAGAVVTRPAKDDFIRKIWHRFQLHSGIRPTVGSLAVGGTAMLLAAEIGVAEVALGTLFGYAAYRMLRYGVPLREALIETLRLEKELPV